MYNLGDIVMMKKQHACGVNRWEVVRLGADIKVRCLGCGHQVMLKRSYFEKKFKINQKPYKTYISDYF